MVLLESQIKLRQAISHQNFELPGIDDKTHALSDYSGCRGVLIIFMCNHCPYVKAKADALTNCMKSLATGLPSSESTATTRPAIQKTVSRQ